MLMRLKYGYLSLYTVDKQFLSFYSPAKPPMGLDGCADRHAGAGYTVAGTASAVGCQEWRAHPYDKRHFLILSMKKLLWMID
jgi:hypothetical protein